MGNKRSRRGLTVWLPTIRTGTGSDVYTLRLADGLKAAGHTPVVQFFPGLYELAPWLLAGVEPPRGIDLVHANSWNAYVFRRNHVPLIVTEHHYIGDPEYQRYRSPAQALYHRVHVLPSVYRSYAAASTVVAVSRHTARAILRQRRIDAVSIHNWVDTNAFSPVSSVSSVRRPIKCLFVGNPSKRKGSDILPDLVNLLPKEIEVYYLGGLRRESPLATRHPQLVPLVRRPPEQMPALYRQMDVALVPTRYEAFGYVALEAMASGIPVAGFDSTGTAEICIQGETALLTPVDDLHALANNLIRLYEDPALRVRLGNNGRDHALANFTPDAAIQAYLKVYHEAISARDSNLPACSQK